METPVLSYQAVHSSISAEDLQDSLMKNGGIAVALVSMQSAKISQESKYFWQICITKFGTFWKVNKTDFLQTNTAIEGSLQFYLAMALVFFFRSSKRTNSYKL